jgi:peptide/nickel transport system ATP-binding protein
VFISHDLALVRYLADRIAVMYLGWLVDVGTAEAVFEPPHHPYTEALASAIPTLDLDVPRPRIKLEGILPSPADPPSGCRFHTRCPRFLGEVCRTVEPPWQRDGASHTYRCHIPPDELRDAQLAAREAPAARPTPTAAEAD